MYIYLYNNSKTNVNSIRRLTGAKDITLMLPTRRHFPTIDQTKVTNLTYRLIYGP